MPSVAPPLPLAARKGGDELSVKLGTMSCVIFSSLLPEEAADPTNTILQCASR